MAKLTKKQKQETELFDKSKLNTPSEAVSLLLNLMKALKLHLNLESIQSMQINKFVTL